MNKMVVLITSFFSILFAIQVVAAKGDKEDLETVRNSLNKMFPIKSIKYIDKLGIYQSQLTDGTFIFSNSDASNFIVGELYSVENNRPINITEKEKNKEKMIAVKSIDPKDMVIFPAKSEKVADMYVFTDVDCGYCRKVQDEIEIYLNNGIQVNYIAWPRCGTKCKSYDKMVSVWCADDRREAMAIAKSGETPETKICDNPVEEQYKLGVSLGLQGTPFIVIDDGTAEGGWTVPGYKPASQIIRLLEG